MLVRPSLALHISPHASACIFCCCCATFDSGRSHKSLENLDSTILRIIHVTMNSAQSSKPDLEYARLKYLVVSVHIQHSVPNGSSWIRDAQSSEPRSAPPFLSDLPCGENDGCVPNTESITRCSLGSLCIHGGEAHSLRGWSYDRSDFRSTHHMTRSQPRIT
jgi:hypothetical protein